MAKQHSPGFLKVAEAARSRVREIPAEEVRQKLDAGAPVRLVDVREDSEWDAGHVPGAEHIGRGVLERDVEVQIPDFDSTIILYCGGGYRSALAADALQQMGYTNVYSMMGGWTGWTEKGLPVQKD